MMLKTIADLCNNNYVKLTTAIAEKQAALGDAQLAYDAAIQAAVDCKNQLFDLFDSASITNIVYILTDSGILLKIDPVARTIEEIE